ncbi:MAG: BamA/TamA family outer membrane protein [Verrucomicrobiales bacterium]|nr:BamA/TamA family outer membrane protein [Verrucomicrobiales bacterium]
MFSPRSMVVGFLVAALGQFMGSLSTWSASFDVTRFEVSGNSALGADEVREVLREGVGAGKSLEEIRRTLAKLRDAYRARGYEQVRISAPRQVLMDGTVALVIEEGPIRSEPSAAVAALGTPRETPAPPARPQPTFEVRSYEVVGNTLLRPEVVERAFTNAIGTHVTLAQIQGALGSLQLAYRERGFATASVSLPQQQLTNAVVKVQVTEGVLTEIRVTGNRYFSSNNVVRALPSLHANQRLNSLVFQRELDLANQNRDRQIYPTLGPGPDPGTSQLTLRVKDRLPVHGRLEVNNHSTPGTPDWRINASAQYNNLWQREHQAGVSYGFTPEEFKTEGLVDDAFFNRPLISNFGAYYRLPLGGPSSVSDRISANSAFGYDEATRQFRLPPAGNRPDLSFFVSGSSSDTGVQYGPENLVSQTPLLTIISQDSGQNLSENDAYGTRFNLPFGQTERRRWNLSAGFDWKRYLLESYNTNNFIIVTVVTNAQGSQTIESRVSSPQPARRQVAEYLPVALGLDYGSTDSGGTLSASLGLSVNGLGDSEDFRGLAYSREARAEFGRATLAITRDQKVGRDWSLLLRANAQAATGPLISNEQFAVGGLNSVRGYYEGDEYGDAGWFSSVEIRSPYLAGRVPVWADFAPVWLRATAFFDVGQRILLDTDSAQAAERWLSGAGFGLSANLNNHADLRLVVAWPLFESANTRAGEARAYFSLGGQF